MQDHYLDAIISDPTLRSPAAARALLELARRASPRDPDIAGDVVLLLTERLQPGGMIRERLAGHANPGASRLRNTVGLFPDMRDAWWDATTASAFFRARAGAMHGADEVVTKPEIEFKLGSG